MQTLFACTCKNEECENEFMTNDRDNLQCPSCGCEIVDCKVKQAVILDLDINLSEETLGNELQQFIKNNVIDLNDLINERINIDSMIRNYFSELSIPLPIKINLNLEKEWETEKTFYEYLDSVSVEGIDEDVKEKVEDELYDLINDNLSIHAMKEIGAIKFK